MTKLIIYVDDQLSCRLVVIYRTQYVTFFTVIVYCFADFTVFKPLIVTLGKKKIRHEQKYKTAKTASFMQNFYMKPTNFLLETHMKPTNQN